LTPPKNFSRTDWPPIDLLGRKQPRPFTWIGWMRAFPWLVEYFDQDVPDQFWAVESFADDRQVMIISCPCGEEPTVPEGSCEECNCGRFFLNLGDRIKVARPEGVQTGVPTPSVD
jgi:hypothetical protein